MFSVEFADMKHTNVYTSQIKACKKYFNDVGNLLPGEYKFKLFEIYQVLGLVIVLYSSYWNRAWADCKLINWRRIDYIRY